MGNPGESDFGGPAGGLTSSDTGAGNPGESDFGGPAGGLTSSDTGIGAPGEADFGEATTPSAPNYGPDFDADMAAAIAASAPPAEAMYSPGVSYADLAAMQALGMGKQDVPGNPDQTIDQALASQSFHSAMNTYAPAIASAMVPGFGALSTIASIAGNLASGKSTVGQTAVSTGLAVAANQLGVPVGVVAGMINGNFGQAAAAAAMSALTGAIANSTGLDPGLVGLGMNVSGIGKGVGTEIAGAVNSVTGAPTSSNLSSIAGGIDSALSGMGVSTGGGGATTSGGSNTGFTGGDGGAGGNSPGIFTGDFGNVANTGTSNSGLNLAGLAGLAGMTNAAAPKGGYRTVGKAGSDPMQKSLQQLNLDENIMPEYAYLTDETPAMVDLNKAMRTGMGVPQESSFYAAQGGLAQHFAEGGAPTASAAVLADKLASAEMDKALADLGKIGTEVKTPQHNLRTVKDAGMAYTPKVLPRLASLLQARGMTLAEGGQPSDTQHPNYDGMPVFRTGGLEGLGGKYVEGKGDGTSDDITAMLANGEYVFSADVVSALGNGSNKAGAERLSEMVKAIRERARSAPPDKLPPDAKSPLEYLKSPKGKKNG